VLKIVRYVTRARRNLITCGKLHGNNYVSRVDMGKLTMRVKKDKKLVLKGMRTRNNLYKVHVIIIPGGAGEEEVAAGSTWATQFGEDSHAGSCK
jgi:hypothetical protein